MRRSVYIHLAVLAVLFIMPQFAHAATTEFFGPIFPGDICNCVGSAPAWGCVLQVFQNVLNAFVSLSVIGISLYIAYSGIQLMMNPTNEEKRTQARQGFTNAIIGLLIVLCAWLLVDSVMKVLYNSSDTKFGPWYSILSPDGAERCLEVRAPGDLPGLSITDPRTQNDIANGGAGNVTVVKGKPTVIPSGNSIQKADSYLPQICAAAKQSNILGQGNVLVGVLGVESHGDPNAVSNIKVKNKDGSVSIGHAYGLMQLIPETAATNGVSACRGSTMLKASAECIAALKDPQTNINAGVRYFSSLYSGTHGNLDNAIAAYNGGLKAAAPSTVCPGTTAWQCTTNSGYGETRKYVPNVEAWAQKAGHC